MGKVADRLQANANQLRELIREALKQNLEPDEELRWFSTLEQRKATAPVRMLLSWGVVLPIGGPLLAALLVNILWYVGITPERVLFGRIKRPFKPDPSGVIAVPLADVTVGRRGQSGGELFVANPRDGLPKKFTLFKGIDIDELQALLSVQPAVPAPASAPAESAPAASSLAASAPVAAPAGGPAIAAPSWMPTHMVPPAGMPAWDTPDPSCPPASQLPANLELMVESTSGGWAQVRTANGWKGWVDSRLITPSPGA